MSKDNHPDTADKKPPLHCKLLKPYYLVPVFFLTVIAVYLIVQSRSSENLHVNYLMTMDTSVELRFTGGSSKDAVLIREDVVHEMERLEALFSRSIAGSDVSLINDSAGLRPVRVDSEVLYVTERAVIYAGLSEGAFDPTIAPLIDLWGFLGQNYRVPTAVERIKSLPLVDYTLIEVDEKQTTVYLQHQGMSLDLGGIAKGFIVDQALQVLMTAGVEHAFINAGGDIGLIGSKPDGSPWRIGVRHPRDEEKIIAVLPAIGGAVVTSGDYQRVFEEEGVSYHHILDPETGLPARELISVTIIAQTAIEADALSTAVFVLGSARGMALIEQLPGVEGILITPELKILVSSGLVDIVELYP
ncbi:MAG: FAD:protein FMN transferase [Clostridia bacterium]|nr:FAD:protein FMN transferase [Clostridia bacterium]